MPIFDYRCTACDRTFELLVRNGTTVACPACGATKVEKLLSVPARPASGRGGTPDFSSLGPPKGGCCGGACGGHSH
ncbi:MAG TPA: zinc ribbon domain-containing protein [Gemmatimonadales bacterium]|nr:zinc ribbon domain-containing protein [Gemmatimonadales bacterium]